MSNFPYSLVVGSLMYAMVCIWPNISHAISVVSGYMSNPSMEHWNVVKWIPRYLRGTKSKALCFRGSNFDLSGFFHSNLVGDIDMRRSTT